MTLTHGDIKISESDILDYLDEEDRKLIISFIEKLKSELNSQSQN